MADINLVAQFDATGNLGGELKKLESGVIRFVGAVSSALTAISVIGFPVAASAAFQRELLEAAKTTDFTREQTQLLREGLVDLSTQIDVSAVDLAKIATMGGQLGIGAGGNVAALTAFTTEVARAVTALDISAEEAVASFGKLINIFNIPPDQFKNAISALNEVSNTSNATSEELFDVVRRIGNLGGSVSFPEATAISAAMIDLGLTAETAGTTVTKIFADMKSRAADFAAFIGQQNGFQGGMAAWVDLVSTDGLAALDLFLDRLNSIPGAAAAAAKVDLTGGGRIFEAVTKLQEQRLRAQELLNQAQRLENDIQSRGADVTEEELKLTQGRVAALRQQAEQVNVITRLTKNAQDGFDGGDSAQREQQTVLSGLSRQWDVFMNRVTAVAMSIGDVLLPPLTEALKTFGAALNQDSTKESLRQAAQDIVDAGRLIVGVLGDIKGAFSALEGSGIDWGSALQLGALLAGMAALKGVASLFFALTRSAAEVIAPMGAVGRALFGTVVPAANAAQRSMAALNDTVQRTGGLFNAFSAAGMATAATNIAAIEQAQARLASTTNFLGQAQARLAQRQVDLQAVQGRVLPQLRSIQALTAEIARLDGLRTAATSSRQAAGYTSQINRLTAVLNDMQAAERRLRLTEAAVDRISGSVVRTQTQIDVMNTGFTRVARTVSSTVVASLQAALSTARAVNDAIRAGQVAAATSGAGSGLGYGLNAFGASLRSSIANAFSGSALQQALTGVRGFATTSGRILRDGLNAGLNGLATGGALSGLSATVSSIATSLRGLNTGSVVSLRDVFTRLTTAAGNLALSMIGIREQWQNTSGAVARGGLLMVGGVNAVRNAISGLFTILSRFINVAFFAVMLKEVLQLVGLWDKFLASVQAVWGFFGGNADALPAWLQTGDQTKKRIAETEEMRRQYELMRENAARFTETMEAEIAALSNLDIARRALAFDASDPSASSSNLANGIDAAISGYSALAQNAKARKDIEDRITLQIAKQAELQDRLAKLQADGFTFANPLDVVRGESGLQKEIQDVALGLAGLRRELSDVDKSAEGMAGLVEATENIGRAMFSAADATALLARSGEDSVSTFEEWAAKLGEVATLQRQLENLRTSDSRAAGTAGSGETQAVAAQELYNQELELTRGRLKAAREEFDALNKQMVQGASSPLTMAKNLETLQKATDPKALQAFSSAIASLFNRSNADAFTGSANPIVNADSVLEAGTEIAVLSRVRNMYQSWSNLAATEAKRAENYVTTAMAEIQKMARDTQAFLDRMAQLSVQAQNKARNQRADRADDATLRQRLNDIQTEYDIERALLDQIFGQQTRMFAEQEAGGLRVSNLKQQAYAEERQALFELDERFRKRREAEEDLINLRKAQRGAKDEIAQFDQLLRQVDEYKKRVEEANAVISNESAPLDTRLAAVTQREQAVTKLKSLYDQLTTSAENLASMDPIAGKLVVEPAEIERLRDGVDEVADKIGKVNAQGVDKIPAIWNTISGQYNAAAQGMETQIKNLSAAFEKMAGSSAESINQVRSEVADMLADASSLESVYSRITEMTQQGIVAPGSISTDSVKNFVREATAAVQQEMATKTVPLTISAEAGAIATQIAAEIQSGFQNSGKQKVEVGVTDSSFVAIEDEIEARVRPVIEVEAKVRTTSIDGRLTAFDVQPPIQRAGGGPVWGAGTATSDSIPAWLSNGEHVIDAFTTSYFGHSLFSTLRWMAKAGKSLSFLPQLTQFKAPVFRATGGPVGALPSLSGIANDFKMAAAGDVPTERMEITLVSGDKRATVQARRESVQSLMDVLGTFKR